MSQKLKQGMVSRSEEELQGVKDTFHYRPDSGMMYYKVDRGCKKVGDIAGSTNTRGYKRVKFSGKHYAYHHVCWFLHYGTWPDHNIDHIDRDPLNNVIGNLREATLSQQQSNAKGWGYCKYKGVCYREHNSSWMAYINKDGVRYNLGYFSSDYEAAKVVDAKARELYGGYAYQNLKPELGPQEPHVKLVGGEPF